MKIWKAILCVLIVSLLVSMAMPMASAGKGGNKPPPDEEPPADPAIVYTFQTSGSKPNRLMVMNDDGTNQVVIYEEYFSPYTISWSPDGNSIAWSGSMRGDPYETNGVWRIDVEIVDGVPQGINFMQLVSSDDVGGYIGGAAWSPLGDEIAYRIHLYDGSTDIFRIDAVPATGGDPYNIYTSPDGYGITAGSRVTWRSDGTQIAFTGGVLSAGSEGISIMIIDRETGDVTDTLVTGEHPNSIDWAQDLDIIAFVGTQGICTVDIGTGIVELVIDGYSPSWSPDNSKIVYLQAGRKPKISTYEFSTGDITPLTSGGMRPDWRRF